MENPGNSYADIPFNENGLLPGFSLPPQKHAALHERLGRELDPRIYELTLQGHRLLVAPDPVDRMHKGLLFMPASAIERQQINMAAGTIIAVGPLVGSPGAPHPVGALCRHPRDLLGAHIIYQAHSGFTLRTGPDDDEFGGPTALVIMTDRDISVIDGQWL